MSRPPLYRSGAPRLKNYGWICPDCETENYKDVCKECGLKKPKFNK